MKPSFHHRQNLDVDDAPHMQDYTLKRKKVAQT